MAGEQRSYMSYLLRLWQAEGEGGMVWRASIQSPHTAERTGFVNLEALFTFLRQQTNAPPDSNAAVGDIACRAPHDP